jgi:hypothetical protein
MIARKGKPVKDGMADLDCELRIAKCENGLKIAELKRLGISIFRHSPFAFRNFSIGGCPKTGQARGPAPTRIFSMPKSEILIADWEKTGHHFSFSQFAFRLSQFLYCVAFP